MKLDPDLVYYILKAAERDAAGEPIKMEVDGYAPDVLQYHVGLCAEAGFLHTKSEFDVARKNVLVTNLTWLGHMVLSKLRRGVKLEDCGTDGG